jgi:hypothetical protein
MLTQFPSQTTMQSPIPLPFFRFWIAHIVILAQILCLDGYKNTSKTDKMTAVFIPDWVAKHGSWASKTEPAPLFKGLTLRQAAFMMGTHTVRKEYVEHVLNRRLQRRKNSTLPKHYDLRTSAEGIKCGGQLQIFPTLTDTRVIGAFSSAFSRIFCYFKKGHWCCAVVYFCKTSCGHRVVLFLN